MDNFRRRTLVSNISYPKDAIDLGLASGTLWAVGNLAKDSQGNYYLCNERDIGTFVSWGNIDGHNIDEVYAFKKYEYANTTGSSVSADIPSNDSTHDICVARLGDSWRVPTKDEYLELYNNTDKEYTSINGINGWKFMKKTDHTVFVFLSAQGFSDNVLPQSEPQGYNTAGCYWLSSYNSAEKAYDIYFSGSSLRDSDSSNRYYGYGIRPVQTSADDYIDLGLPSGRLWARGNLCLNGSTYYIGKPWEYGTYVSWGNITGHNSGYSFSSSNYNSTTGSKLTADIPSNDAQHDICLAKLGTPWHLPTKDDFIELYDNTDNEIVSDYAAGVAGIKFMKKTDHSIFIFFPFSGCYNSGSSTLKYKNTEFCYWTSSLYSSSYAYNIWYNGTTLYIEDYSTRYQGFPVRPVISGG